MPTTSISYLVTDAEGESIRQVIHFDSSDVTTVAEAQDAFTDFELLLEDVMGPAIEEAYVTIPLTVSAVETPDSGYSVWSGATLSVRDSDGKGQSIYVPGILQAFMQDKIVIASGTEMATFLADLLTNGFGTGGHRVSSAFSGALWNEYVRGKRATRKP